MKKLILLLVFILNLNTLFAQTPTECLGDNGYHLYYAELIIDNVPDDFDKEDLLAHMVAVDNISNSDYDILNQEIQLVEKPFPTAETPSLQKTVSLNCISDTLETFFSSFTNSFNFVEYVCQNVEVLSTIDSQNQPKIKIYPNPITENSIIEFNSLAGGKEIQIRIINQQGQIIDSENIKNKGIINFDQFELAKGFYLVQVVDNNNGRSELFKIIKIK